MTAEFGKAIETLNYWRSSSGFEVLSWQEYLALIEAL